MDQVRTLLERLMRERGDDYLSISKLLGKNAAYVQQFMKRNVPRKLKEDDRRVLARYFGVDEVDLGGPAAPVNAGTIRVPRLRLGASAGPGALTGEEETEGTFGFESRWLKKLSASPDALSIIQVAGDSMAPTLGDGDDILVDTGDAADRLREGIYVIRLDDVLLVKRLAPSGKKAVKVKSDNPAYPDIDADLKNLAIIGRVVWVGRKIG
jgi:Peptidase S24-like